MSQNKDDKGLSRRGFLGVTGAAAAAAAALPLLKGGSAAAAPAGIGGWNGNQLLLVCADGGPIAQRALNGTLGAPGNPYGAGRPVWGNTHAMSGLVSQSPGGQLRATGMTIDGTIAGSHFGLDLAGDSIEADFGVIRNFASNVDGQSTGITGAHENGRAWSCTGYAESDNKPGLGAIAAAIAQNSPAGTPFPACNLLNNNPFRQTGAELVGVNYLQFNSPQDATQLRDRLLMQTTSEAERARLTGPSGLARFMTRHFNDRVRSKDAGSVQFSIDKVKEIEDKIRQNSAGLDPMNAINAPLWPMFGLDGTGRARAGINQQLAHSFLVAFRLLGLGAPVVSIGAGSFDFHADESPQLQSRFGTMMHGFFGVLRAARTKMYNVDIEKLACLEVGDFNRNNYNGGGFNGGGGADHNGGDGMIQAVMFGGGGFGGKVYGDGLMDGGDQRKGSNVLLGRHALRTMLEWYGGPSAGERYFPGARNLWTDLKKPA